MSTLPWFPLYGSDFFDSPRVKMMDNATGFVYLKLLWAQWQMGALPNDPVKLARLVHERPEAFAVMWPSIRPCFSEAEVGLANDRLEVERVKANAKSEQAREAAMKSWENRRRRQAEEDGRNPATTPAADAGPDANAPADAGADGSAATATATATVTSHNSQSKAAAGGLNRPDFSGDSVRWVLRLRVA